MVTPEGRQVPMIVAIGNHEVFDAAYRPLDALGPDSADEFFTLFQMQEEGQARQAIDFKSGLSLILLDSGHSANLASQVDWLKANLEKRKDVKRLFVCYHRPAWGCGTKEDAADIQKQWCPLFEEYLVDAVFENDHHVHSRSLPIISGKIDDKKGIPYLGSGAWGAAPRQIPADYQQRRPWIVSANARNHFWRIELSEDRWEAKAMDAEGEVFDYYKQSWRR